MQKRKYPTFAQQTWRHIFFLHWRLESKMLDRFIPAPLILDTYRDTAWLTVVIFQAKDSRLKKFPKLLSFRPMLQINVRTYVYHPELKERGVYFFSLNVDHFLMTSIMRTMFSLPVKRMNMTYRKNKCGSFHLLCKKKADVLFQTTCVPTKRIHRSELATFLTERYSIWTVCKNVIKKLPLSHSSWDLYEANVSIETNHITPFMLTGEPVVHYAKEKVSHLHFYETYPFKYKITH